MKPTPKQRLRATSLGLSELKKVHGGRGSVCGISWHCDECGNMWSCEGGIVCPGCGISVNHTVTD